MGLKKEDFKNKTGQTPRRCGGTVAFPAGCLFTGTEYLQKINNPDASKQNLPNNSNKEQVLFFLQFHGPAERCK